MSNFHLLWLRGELHKESLQEHQRLNVILNLGKVRVLGYMIQVDESKYNRSGIYQLSCPQHFHKSKQKILKKKLPCLMYYMPLFNGCLQHFALGGRGISYRAQNWLSGLM
jgi:hypothetical protein